MLWLLPLILLLSVNADTQDAGDSCIHDRGEEGVCTPIFFCPSAADAIYNDEVVTSCDSSEALVCCVDTVPTTAAPAPTTPKHSRVEVEVTEPDEDYEVYDYDEPDPAVCEPLTPKYAPPKNGNKAWDKCLEYQELVFPCRRQKVGSGMEREMRCLHAANKYVLHGEDAAENEFPHMALLGFGEEDNMEWSCGGSLISDRFVLTAGHCIASTVPVSHVAVGILSRSDLNNNTIYRVKTIIKHPLYASPKRYHDIALLELDTPVPLSEYIVPACIDTGRENVTGRNLTATGWGFTDNYGTHAERLQKVILQSFDISECKELHEPNRYIERGIDGNTQICYGDKFGHKDTCQGDSGGPLQVSSSIVECMYTVVGVTSFGAPQCGRVGVPAVYTRVQHYIDWIADTVWP